MFCFVLFSYPIRGNRKILFLDTLLFVFFENLVIVLTPEDELHYIFPPPCFSVFFFVVVVFFFALGSMGQFVAYKVLI